MTAIATFLTHVWSRQPQTGYGTIARKRHGVWTERYVRNHGPRIAGSDVDDLYFTATLFSAPDHRAEHALPSRWLLADLDEAHPWALAIPPTLAWQTSRHHFQCLWLLDRPLAREPFEDLNKRLTYYLGADHTGWDVGQLLRIPGSVSTKHGYRHRVRLLRTDRCVYRYEELAALVPDAPVTAGTTGAAPPLPEASHDAAGVLARYKLRTSDRRLLTQTQRVSDRSGHLHHLYPRLFALGMTCDEVYAVVCASVLLKSSKQWMWADICRAHQRYEAAR